MNLIGEDQFLDMHFLGAQALQQIDPLREIDIAIVVAQDAVAIWFMYYNFSRVHQTLRVTPAMESGISNHVWTIEEL